MNIIVTADSKWGIGRRGERLVHIPGVDKAFREEIRGKVLIMGRKTYEKEYKGMPLLNDKAFILTRNKDYELRIPTKSSGLKIRDTAVHSLEELMDHIQEIPDEDIYVVGGREIFELLLPYCKVIHVTKLDRKYEADVFFPDLDKEEAFVLAEEGEEETCFDMAFEYLKYVRKPGL